MSRLCLNVSVAALARHLLPARRNFVNSQKMPQTRLLRSLQSDGFPSIHLRCWPGPISQVPTPSLSETAYEFGCSLFVGSRLPLPCKCDKPAAARRAVVMDVGPGLGLFSGLGLELGLFWKT
jgi:hypothetical protein